MRTLIYTTATIEILGWVMRHFIDFEGRRSTFLLSVVGAGPGDFDKMTELHNIARNLPRSSAPRLFR